MVYSYESFLIEFGAKLRAMRHDRGWSLRWMIIEHGFHLAQWQGFEKGRGISVPSLMRLCEVFDLTMEELIEGLGRVESSASLEALPERVASAKSQKYRGARKQGQENEPETKRSAKTARPASMSPKKNA